MMKDSNWCVLGCERYYPEPVVIHLAKHRRAPIRDIMRPQDVCPASVTEDDLVNGYYTSGNLKYECELGCCNEWYKSD